LYDERENATGIDNKEKIERYLKRMSPRLLGVFNTKSSRFLEWAEDDDRELPLPLP